MIPSPHGQQSFFRLYQRVSAIFLAITLWLHFHLFLRQFIASGGIRYSDLVARLSSPWYKLLEIAFTFFAVTHGLCGVWSRIDAWVHTDNKKPYAVLLWVTGSILVLSIATIILLR